MIKLNTVLKESIFYRHMDI